VADGARFIQGDAGDPALVGKVLGEGNIDAVVHFAGHIVVPESVDNPLKYYGNNVRVSQTLVEQCVANDVNNFIFSSSAAVYGMPSEIPAHEELPLAPINPYGATKLITEWLLRDVSSSDSSFRHVALRYFNVAGAHASGELGQATPDATHLIKIASQAAIGARDKVMVFGDDYDTADGTCIRDYIHIEDLAAAHLAALKYLLDGGESNVFNCGYGHGYSVREVLDAVKRVSGVDFKVDDGPRRAGDPPELVAANDRIRQALGFAPKFDDLELICRSAVAWEKNGRG